MIQVAGRSLHLRRLGATSSATPLVFLHEGLGSVDLWRDFADAVVVASGHPGFAYSRYGNGWSTPLSGPRKPDYMHVEALEVLPRVLAALDAPPPILIGHSDGASIALLYAGFGYPVRGLVLIAPHVFVEPKGIEAIAAINGRFPSSDLPTKMAKYHAEPEATFRGWADIWLNPAFRTWNIEDNISGLRCPVLVIQGDADEYGTIRQLDAIDAAIAAPAQRSIIPGAGHSPHLSDTEAVTKTVADFIERIAQ